ncbi:MAG: SUMF1/EgtB/PvdO family nonheme iron enzyme [Acidobacteria bacterium]|nr:SUMF1/EgtB/PvdO family nonheme iron enzyme [Acidobacteriota bacterium]
MRKGYMIMAFCLCLSGCTAAVVDCWCPQVTNVLGWKTELAFYNPGTRIANAFVMRYNADGVLQGDFLIIPVPPLAWASVPSADMSYNGTARVTSDRLLKVKAAFQSGTSPSLCEIFLTSERCREWILPNSVRSWMDYTGISMVNPGADPVLVELEAWMGGVRVGTTQVTLGAGDQYVRLSNEIWEGIEYTEFDTFRIRCGTPLPAPIGITGNYSGDRHLFFGGQPLQDPEEPVDDEADPPAGDQVFYDPIVGVLRFVPPGNFTQGSSVNEPCRSADEAQFSHTLTYKLAVMETELSYGDWLYLHNLQPTLPAKSIDYLSWPVECSWYEAVLYANLLSKQNSLKPCYYIDPAFISPLSAANYTTGICYCDWNADGFRLPTEGEWEYLCRAGTTTPFWIPEPNYTAERCGDINADYDAYDQLETAAYFFGNWLPGTHGISVYGLAVNPWNLHLVHGNAEEWCWDEYAAYPTGPATDYRCEYVQSFSRILRGGYYTSRAKDCRSARRAHRDPGEISGGVRLVRSLGRVPQKGGGTGK